MLPDFCTGSRGWGTCCFVEAPPITSENRAIVGLKKSGVPEGESRESDMDLSKTRFDRVDIGAKVRAFDWSATVLGPLLSTSLATCRRKADAPLTRIEPEKEADR